MYTEIWENIEQKFGHVISSDECSLGLLLLAIFSQAQSCRLSIKTGMHSALISIHKGKIVGGQNIPKALDKLSITSLPNESLDELVGRAMSKGHAPNTIFQTIGVSLGNYLAAANRVKDAQFELMPFEAPEVSVPLSGSLVSCFLAGVDATVPDDKLELRFSRMNRYQVEQSSVDWSRARLSPQLIGILRNVSPNSRLSDVLKSRNFSTQWRLVNHLIALGLLNLKANKKARQKNKNVANDEKIAEMREVLSAFGDNPELIPSYKILGLTVPGMVNAKSINDQYR
ncbi:MAG: hypothetical protein VXZ96_11710, partial [Myxococcota bacterium]|nr:hypothetical protein [Myxococcota bacterium]